MRLTMRGKNGQVILESTITLVLFLLLFGGIFKVWMWGNKQIVERQIRYNATRVKAGSSSDNYELVWPVYKGPELTDEDIFVGGK